jgi:hypothetical protein
MSEQHNRHDGEPGEASEQGPLLSQQHYSDGHDETGGMLVSSLHGDRGAVEHDDFLSKPMGLFVMRHSLKRWLPPPARAENALPAVSLAQDDIGSSAPHELEADVASMRAELLRIGCYIGTDALERIIEIIKLDWLETLRTADDPNADLNDMQGLIRIANHIGMMAVRTDANKLATHCHALESALTRGDHREAVTLVASLALYIQRLVASL